MPVSTPPVRLAIVGANFGAGIQTFSGSNGYTGTTTISGGTLQFAKQASLYGNNTASWTNSNIIVNSGATLALNVGGTNEFTTSDLGTLETNLKTSITNNGLRAGSAIGLDTTNATGGESVYNGVIGNSSGTGAGAVGLTKLGSGTLTLNGANTYTGNTTINGGILALGATGSISSATLVFNLTDAVQGQLSVANSGFSFSGTLNLGLSAFTLGGGSFQLFAGSEFGAGDLNLAALTSSLGAFTNNSGTWTLASGDRTFTFDQSLGTLTVVPEPHEYALAFSLMLGLLIAARRRRMRAQG